MEKCKYETEVIKFFNLKENVEEDTPILVDFGILVNLLCSFDQSLKKENIQVYTCKKCKSFVFTADGKNCEVCNEPCS